MVDDYPEDSIVPLVMLVAVALVVTVALVAWAGVRDRDELDVRPVRSAHPPALVLPDEVAPAPVEGDLAWHGWRTDLYLAALAAEPDVEVSSMAIERQPSGEVVVTNPPEAPVAVEPVGDLEALICSYPWNCSTALRVAACESTMDPTAISPGGDMGLMQVNPVHRGRVAAMGYQWEQLLDPHVNLEVAWSIYVDAGHTWRPWTCARGLG